MTTDYAELARELNGFSFVFKEDRSYSTAHLTEALDKAAAALDHLSAENAILREITDDMVERAYRAANASQSAPMICWDSISAALTAALQQGDKK